MNRLVRNTARVALIVAVPAALAGCGINTIPTQDEATKAAWAEVQNTTAPRRTWCRTWSPR